MPCDDAVDEVSEHGARRNVFAERHQLNFVVPCGDVALRRNQIGAIGQAGDSIVTHDQSRRAEEDRFAEVARELKQRVAVTGVVGSVGGIAIVGLEQERRGGLGPYDQVRTLLGALRRSGRCRF